MNENRLLYHTDALASRFRSDVDHVVDAGTAPRPDIIDALRLGCRIPPAFFDPDPDPDHAPSRPDGVRRGESGRRTALVLGNGVMAQGIAEVLTRAGCDAHLAGRDAARVDAALHTARSSSRRGAGTAEEKVDRARRITASVFTAVPERPWDLVIEASSEQRSAKRQTWEAVCDQVPADAMVATTTSSLRVQELAELLQLQGRLIGLHFFNPAPVSPLVEVVVPADVDPAAAHSALALVEQLGKTAIRSADTPGFIVNRLLIPHLNRALGLATTVGDARRVDSVFRTEYGFPLGPCRLIDLIGADTVLEIHRNLHSAFPDHVEQPHPALETLVATGATGDKAGRGVLDLLKAP